MGEIVSCVTCVYFDALTGPMGVCRRYPPTPVFYDAEIHSHFPHMHEDDYCGEWKESEVDDES